MTECSMSFKFRCPWMLPLLFNVFFSCWCLFNFGEKPLTTENTENETPPKICTIPAFLS